MKGDKQRLFYPNASSLNDFWYFVGLVATDGCLLKDGRHINITSAEKDYLLLITKRFGLSNKIGSKSNGAGSIGYQLQLGNARLWRDLFQIGLMPKKSLILGSLQIPDLFFSDFLRGVIDGDGCIRRWLHPQNGGEQWSLTVYSSAPIFSKWLYDTIVLYFGVKGVIIKQENLPPQHTAYRIKFGKMAARKVLAGCYRKGDLVLPRKQLLAERCIASYSGWTRSFTVKMQIPARVE